MTKREKAEAVLKINILRPKALSAFLGDRMSYTMFRNIANGKSRLTLHGIDVLAEVYDILYKLYGISFIKNSHLE